MFGLSAAAHLALAVAVLAFPPLSGAPLRIEPVAVVDLVGGGEFRRETAKPPEPAPIAREEEKPAPRGRTEPTPPPARSRKGAKTAPDGIAPSKRQAADVASLS